MTEQRQAVKFRLLRIEGTAADSRAIPIDLFKTLDEAVAAAARQPRQPTSPLWKVDTEDGVWSRLDDSGQGFVIHRIDLAL